ncbi:MAG TPA: NAD(P)-binding protein [Solirubrobacterales bacterium]|nr:NAD(P)-binding protein [Solirubrobacterales bacterium]
MAGAVALDLRAQASGVRGRVAAGRGAAARRGGLRAGALRPALADELQRSGHRVLGVDFDPRAVESWAETGHPAVYGDLEDPEFAATLPLDRVRWVVSSVPGRDANLAMIHALGEQGYRGRIAATAHYEEDAEQLRRRGATEVFNPFAVAAERAVATLQRDG